MAEEVGQGRKGLVRPGALRAPALRRGEPAQEDGDGGTTRRPAPPRGP